MARIGARDRHMHIGSVVWYLIGDDASATLDELHTWFEELDLDRDLLPSRLRMVDSWRVATTAAGGEVIQVGDRTATIRIEEGESDRAIATRNILWTFDDRTYEQVGQFIYIRPERTDKGNIPGTDSHHYELKSELSSAERKAVENFCRRVDRSVDERGEAPHIRALRKIIYTLLLAGDQDTIILHRQRGVYWINELPAEEGEPPSHIGRICELVARLGGGSSIDVVPLPDVPRQRDMLGRGLNEQVLSDVSSITVELERSVQGAKRTGGSVTINRHAMLAEQLAALVERSRSLSKLIDRPLSQQAQDAIDGLRKALKAANPAAKGR